MDLKKTEFWLSIMLVIYLLVIGIGSVSLLAINFPTESGDFTFSDNGVDRKIFIPFGTIRSNDQGFLLLALLAGMAGSFLHAAQSLSSYIGNKTFKASWTTWYFMRPWIGGVLGTAIYFVIRAGLIAGTSIVNPYGVVALGILGGWFSKTTTDKLQEVFETLFKTDQDKQRQDKLLPTRPVVTSIEPSPVPVGAKEITIVGENFTKGAIVQFNNEELQANFISKTQLKVSLANLSQTPSAGMEALIKVKNPEGDEPLSEGYKVLFQ